MLKTTNKTGNDAQPKPGTVYDLSVVIVSFNTRDILRRCLSTLLRESAGLSLEVLLVDNGSQDGSVLMVENQFPEVRVIRAGKNLGFAAANNVLFNLACGRYLVLLNSDAFVSPGSLQRALERMEARPDVGLAGGRLIGQDGSWQPSARMFPSLLNDFLSLTGLAYRLARSRFFGRADRTWADPLEETETDWVPGAFSIIRADVLRQIGSFDEAFFLYYEEVDLCRRIKAAGLKVYYWPDIVVVHLGGESAKSVNIKRSTYGAQLSLWRMRSAYLYYRKHHGSAALLSMAIEYSWYLSRLARTLLSFSEASRRKAAESRATMALVRRAWTETSGGRTSPPRPW